MSLTVVIAAAFVWSVVLLLRQAARERASRRRGESPPSNFAGSVAGTAATACLLGAFLIGFARPAALVVLVLAIGFLAVEIIQSSRVRPSNAVR